MGDDGCWIIDGLKDGWMDVVGWWLSLVDLFICLQRTNTCLFGMTVKSSKDGKKILSDNTSAQLPCARAHTHVHTHWLFPPDLVYSV